MTVDTTEAVEYRYFTADLLTNTLLAEIPFSSVSYSRSLVEAGRFSGDIPVIDDTFNLDLYNTTLPGKVALYVVRNGVCVWGGIIWSRSYSLIDKVLSISASEFTSYLSHRNVWKTWSSDYEATGVVSDGVATITLRFGQYGFEVGEAVWIDWGPEYAKYTGYFDVNTATVNLEGKSVITVDATYVDVNNTEKVIPNMTLGVDNPLTVQTRQDTYRYARDLMRELDTDLFDFDFANDAIRPGIDLFNEIDTISRSSNVATVVLTGFHELTEGQRISVTDVTGDAAFNDGNAIVSEIISSNTFTYANPGSDYSAAAETNHRYNVVSFSRTSSISTFTTDVPHNYSANDIILVENVSETFDGYFTVYEVPSSTSFTAVNFGSDIALSFTSVYSITDISGATGNGVSVTFSAANDFTVGAAVSVSGVSPSSFNGDYYVESRTDNSFTVASSNTDTYVSGGKAESQPPRVTRRAAVTYGTFGEHTTVGGLGFDFTDTDSSSGTYEANPIVRGFELKTVAEVLEDYSTKPNGFEYRVDCEYDEDTNSFKRKFKFLPLIPATLTQYLATKETGYSGPIPASAYGAADLIFEYPGNVLEAQLDETAEDSATRFFVRGSDDALSSDASQPYSAASNHILLNDGWPLLDAVDTLESMDETTLYKQAQRLLEESLPPTGTFTIGVNGSVFPRLGDYNPGDWCTVRLADPFLSQRASSNLEQNYGEDGGVLVRKIAAFEVTVPDTPSYPEEVYLELIIEPSIPISGVTVIDGKAFLG